MATKPLRWTCCFYLLGAWVTHAAVLVNFTFNDETTVPSSTAAHMFSTDMDISSANITFGTFSGFPDSPYAQGSTGWDATTQNAAKNFFFTLSSSPGYSFIVTQVVFRARVTSAGPSAFGYSMNGNNLYEQDAAANTTYTITEQVSGFSYQSSATFRIQGWDNDSRETTGGGDFRIDDVTIYGTVHVPEPSSMLMTGLGVAVLLAFRGRRLRPLRRATVTENHSGSAGTISAARSPYAENYLFNGRRMTGTLIRKARVRRRTRRNKIPKPLF